MRATVAALSIVAALGACRSQPFGAAPSPAPPAPAPVAAAAPVVHDPAHPPIDCPLRKQGIVTRDMKPFEQVEKYIEFLERADRAAWQKPDAVVAALDLKGDETVADVGAGSGYFTFRFARALPLGRVSAIDLEPEMLWHVHHKAMAEGLKNVDVVAAAPDDPKVPPGTDLAFVCDVLHHVQDPKAWLARLASELKAGARLVLVEFKEGELPEGPPAAMKIPKADLRALAEGAGFRLVADQDALLPYQTFLVFERR